MSKYEMSEQIDMSEQITVVFTKEQVLDFANFTNTNFIVTNEDFDKWFQCYHERVAIKEFVRLALKEQGANLDDYDRWFEEFYRRHKTHKKYKEWILSQS